MAKDSLQKNSPEQTPAQRQLNASLARLCARVEQTPETQAAIAQLVAQVTDWEGFSEYAASHGIMPLVYAALQRLTQDAVPQRVLMSLKHAHFANVQLALLSTQSLAAVADTFAAAGIDLIPFKGIALSSTIYGDVGLRNAGDIDILVRTADVPEATRILINSGFEAPDHLKMDVTRSYMQRSAFMESAESLRQYQFVKRPHTMVELHWEIGPRHFPFGLNNAQMWEVAQPLSLFNRCMKTLPDVEMLLLLIDHGAKHGWRRLSWIVDIAEYLRRRPDLDWSALQTRAAGLRMKIMLKVALLLASEMLDAPVPKKILSAARADGYCSAIVRRIDAYHLGLSTHRSTQWYEHSICVRISDRLSDRLNYVNFLFTTPTSEEGMMISLPEPLTPLYRVIRLARLATMAAGAVRR